MALIDLLRTSVATHEKRERSARDDVSHMQATYFDVLRRTGGDDSDEAQKARDDAQRDLTAAKNRLAQLAPLLRVRLMQHRACSAGSAF